MEKMTPEKLLGATILCPHCNQKLKVTKCSERYMGIDPSRGILDGFYIITFEDGTDARMWETE